MACPRTYGRTYQSIPTNLQRQRTNTPPRKSRRLAFRIALYPIIIYAALLMIMLAIEHSLPIYLPSVYPRGEWMPGLSLIRGRLVHGGRRREAARLVRARANRGPWSCLLTATPAT